MSDIIKGQDYRRRLKVRRDLTLATSPRIYYTRPDKTKGFWVATKDGQDLYYDVPATENNQVGLWSFEAYYEIGAKKYYGSISTVNVLNNIV